MTTKITSWPTKIEPLPGSKSHGVDPKLVKAGSANPLPHPTSSPAPAKSGSVPVMITRQMEAALRERGFSEEGINGITPAEAWEILRFATPEAAPCGLTSDVSLPAQAKAATTIVTLGTPEFGAEAHRIAAELGRLHQDGVIPNKSAQDPDASFYANLLHSFAATYIRKIGNVSSAVD